MLVGALALLFSLPFVTQLQADTYKALYDGRWILQHGLPHREALTVMAHGRSWVDEQWLAEVVFYQAWKTGGYGLLAGVAIGMVSLAYMILAALMYRRGASVGLVLGCATLGILSLTGWQFIRSQDFALPLFAATLAVCVTDAKRERPRARLLVLLPLLVLWANLHGSVLLGAVLATTYLLVRATASVRAGRRTAAAACGALAVATALTPLATPYGTQIIHYYSEFVGNGPMARMAIEWAPPRFPSFPFFELCVPAALTVGTVGFALLKRRLPSPVLLGAAAMTGAAAAVESGSIIWFGMVATLLLADTAKTWSPARPRSPGFVVLLTVTAVALAGVVLVQLVGRSAGSYESQLPQRVVAATTAYAASHPCATILADNLSSSALLWHDQRLEGRIGFDARLEQYSATSLNRWLAFTDGRTRDWTASVRGYDLLVGDSFYGQALVRRLDRFPTSRLLARQVNGVAVITNTGSSRCTKPKGGRA